MLLKKKKKHHHHRVIYYDPNTKEPVLQKCWWSWGAKFCVATNIPCSIAISKPEKFERKSLVCLECFWREILEGRFGDSVYLLNHQDSWIGAVYSLLVSEGIGEYHAFWAATLIRDHGGSLEGIFFSCISYQRWPIYMTCGVICTPFGLRLKHWEQEYV